LCGFCEFELPEDMFDLPLVASANATSRRPVAMMVYLPDPGCVAYSRQNRIFHNCLAKPNLTHLA